MSTLTIETAARKRLDDFRQRGDPLADALAARFDVLGWEAGMGLLRALVLGGPEAAPDAPAELRALVDSAQRAPAWAEPARLERGSLAYHAPGFLWLSFGLGPGALVRTYRNPRAAVILTHTRNLVRKTRQRIIETGTWIYHATQPGGWAPGSEGLAATLSVRMTHARIRRLAQHSPSWDQEHGLPINQLDMAYVNLAFSRVYVDTLAALGIRFSADELDAIYHLWRYQGLLLGVEPALLVETHAQAGALLARIEAGFEPVGPDGRALVGAMVDSYTNYLRNSLGMETVLARVFSYSLIRTMHGDAVADAFGIPRSALTAVVGPIALGNRLRRAWEALRPDGRRLAAQRELAEERTALVDVLEEPPAFQRPGTLRFEA
ncbi:MAG TPA: oxygenase MpaB family protein [Roseiflexaceae bacterium]|nr:oxygenase MpaB family protein [Roseiflexaceae bacterium]